MILDSSGAAGAQVIQRHDPRRRALSFVSSSPARRRSRNQLRPADAPVPRGRRGERRDRACDQARNGAGKVLTDSARGFFRSNRATLRYRVRVERTAARAGHFPSRTPATSPPKTCRPNDKCDDGWHDRACRPRESRTGPRYDVIIFKNPNAVRRDRGEFSPEPVHVVAIKAGRRSDELGGIDEVRRAARMDIIVAPSSAKRQAAPA